MPAHQAFKSARRTWVARRRRGRHAWLVRVALRDGAGNVLEFFGISAACLSDPPRECAWKLNISASCPCMEHDVRLCTLVRRLARRSDLHGKCGSDGHIVGGVRNLPELHLTAERYETALGAKTLTSA
jgi:hypothetical protein